MRKFNGSQDWYEYVSGRVERELNEAWPKKSCQVILEISGLWL